MDKRKNRSNRKNQPRKNDSGHRRTLHDKNTKRTIPRPSRLRKSQRNLPNRPQNPKRSQKELDNHAPTPKNRRNRPRSRRNPIRTLLPASEKRNRRPNGHTSPYPRSRQITIIHTQANRSKTTKVPTPPQEGHFFKEPNQLFLQLTQ